MFPRRNKPERNEPAGRDDRVRNRPLARLSLLMALATGPALAEQPLAVGGLFALLLGLRLGSLRLPRLVPGRWVMLGLTIGVGVLVMSQFRTLFSYQAASALLALMAALKLLEIRRERDLYVTVILGMFVMVSQFLLTQSLPLALFMGFVTLGFVAFLVEINCGVADSLGLESLKRAGWMLLQALPVVVLLFLLFPRLSAPLWKIHLGDRAALTGLSDRMEPGSVGELIENRDPAFRVEFEGPAPASELRYWRGPVLWHTDGRAWTRGRAEDPAAQGSSDLAERDRPVRYRILLEPHGKRWLFALDLPGAAPAGALATPDLYLVSQTDVTERRHYEVTSYTRYDTGPLAPRERAAGLEVPETASPRMRALVRTWRRERTDDLGVVKAALAFFRHEPFVYTLRPPLLGRAADDEFLFDTRAGFCEHYASAFTVLMRLAGIPARVVTGYLGAEHNPLGDYFIVRQSDAHAWSEVWLAGRGWTRIDPTAAVAPERVIRQILGADEGIGSPVSFFDPGQGPLRRLALGLRLAVDSVNMGWHRWVLGYDLKTQRRMLSWLRLEQLDIRALALLLVGGVGIALAAIGLALRRGTRRKIDPAVALYLIFCRKLRRIGIHRGPNEGPLDLARRAARARPDLAEAIDAITRDYVQIRFAGSAPAARLARLRQSVRRFRTRDRWR